MKIQLLFIGILFFANSAYSQKDKGFNFPPDFGKTPTLVVIGPASTNKVTEGIIEGFEKEYEGKIQRIEDRYGKGVKKDTAVRVFLLTVIEMPSSQLNKNTDDYKFSLTELSSGKRYSADFWSGAYKKGARYYAKHLEKFRKANGGK